MSGPRVALGTGIAWLAVTLLSCLPLGAEVDPFYRQLLEEGVRSYERGDHSRAREELRIAAFGLLETPEELARALAHLALTQSSAGDLEGFAHSYGRLAELETRFRSYSSAALGAEVRGQLETAARSHLGTAILGAVPAPAPAEPAAEVDPVEVAAVQATPVEVERVPAGPVEAKPISRPRLCVSWTGDGECRQPGAAVAPTATELAALDGLDRLASGKASDKKLRAGFERASELADRYPERSDMQRVAAALAARSGSFADAVRYYDRVGELIQEQPLQLFYLSVALFETDQLDAAATTLRRALPALKQNREVRRYMKRILSEESAG